MNGKQIQEMALCGLLFAMVLAIVLLAVSPSLLTFGLFIGSWACLSFCMTIYQWREREDIAELRRRVEAQEAAGYTTTVFTVSYEIEVQSP